MNKVILTGNITKDLELKQSGDTKILKFHIAVKRDKDSVDFIPIAAFGKIAESTAKFCSKGSKVLVTGVLRINQYEDKDKIKRYSTEVIAENYGGIEFLGSIKKVEVDENLFVD